MVQSENVTKNIGVKWEDNVIHVLLVVMKWSPLSRILYRHIIIYVFTSV